MSRDGSRRGRGRSSSIPQAEISQFIEKIHGLREALEVKPPSSFEAVQILRGLGLGEGSAFIFTRDAAIYNTVSIIRQAGFIIGGGYGINTAYFSGYERRLSLADLDMFAVEASEDGIIAALNRVAEFRNLLFNELGVTIGLFQLDPRKTAWLRRIVPDKRLLALQRTVLLPEEYGHGVPLEKYVSRILRKEPWAYRLVRALRSENLNRLKVDTVKIDVEVAQRGEIGFQVRTIEPALAPFHKYFETLEAPIVDPETSCHYFINGLHQAFKQRQTHNFIKMLVDLRLARLIGEERILEDTRQVLEKAEPWLPTLEEEWQQGWESWRFALLRKKYPTLRQLIETWFSSK